MTPSSQELEPPANPGRFIQTLVGDLSERGLSARTVRYTHSILKQALKRAVRLNLISRNPTQYVELPAMKRKEQRALSQVEASAFLEAARGDRWGALWEMLLVTGLRPGEALGLQWGDVAWDNRRIRVLRSLSRAGDYSWKLVPPKTARSRRSVVVPQGTLDTLKRHRAKQLEDRLRAGDKFEDLDLVFSDSTGQPLDYRIAVRRHFKRIVKELGFDGLRAYDLRHTCATLLLAGGEHPKVVSERLGHASTVMTLDVYSHVLPDMQEGASEKLEAMLYGS
jgi:integrase